jgi:hypothetical protein
MLWALGAKSMPTALTTGATSFQQAEAVPGGRARRSIAHVGCRSGMDISEMGI